MPISHAPEVPASLLTRIGTSFGAAAVASLAASIPAAARVASHVDGRFGVPGAWLALAAATLPQMMIAVLLFRGARRGASAFGGDDSIASHTRALAAGAWALASTIALLFFGAALRATTHHHALAGATFAIAGLVLTTVLATLAARMVGIASQWGATAQRVALGVVFVLLLAALLLFSSRVGRTSPPAVALFVDLLGAFLGAGLASGPLLTKDRAFAVVGPILAALLLVAGVAALRLTPNLGASAKTYAPVAGWAAERTDQLVRKH